MSDMDLLGKLQGEGVRLGMLPRAALKWARAEFVCRYGREPALSRDVIRSRRLRSVRARTINMKRMTKREIEIGRLLNPDLDELPVRPRRRLECVDQFRPCPFVSCKYHLYLDVSDRTGAIKLNFPDLEPWELTETCALDVAERGGLTLEDVARIMNLTRERIRQVEVKAESLCKRNESLREYGDGDRTTGPGAGRREHTGVA